MYYNFIKLKLDLFCFSHLVFNRLHTGILHTDWTDKCGTLRTQLTQFQRKIPKCTLTYYDRLKNTEMYTNILRPTEKRVPMTLKQQLKYDINVRTNVSLIHTSYMT